MGKDNECCMLCGGLALCGILVAVILALIGLGISKIVMGAIYLHECSIENMIPVYLIVSGVVPLLFGGCGRNKERNRSFGIGDLCGLLGFLLHVSWLICGSIWVYPNYGKVTAVDFVPCSANVTTNCSRGNCDKDFITFAFAMVTVDWLFFGLGMGLVCYTIITTYRARDY